MDTNIKTNFSNKLLVCLRVLWIAVTLFLVPRGAFGIEGDTNISPFWLQSKSTAQKLKENICPQTINPKFQSSTNEPSNFQIDKTNCNNVVEKLTQHSAASKNIEDQTAAAVSKATTDSGSINDKSSKDLCDLITKYASQNTFGQLSPEIGITENVKQLAESFKSQTYHEAKATQNVLAEYQLLSTSNGTKGLSGLALQQKAEECKNLSSGSGSLAQKQTDDRGFMEKYGGMAAQALGPIAGLMAGGGKKDKGDKDATPPPPYVPSIDSGSSSPANIADITPTNGVNFGSGETTTASTEPPAASPIASGATPGFDTHSSGTSAFNAASGTTPSSNNFGAVGSSPLTNSLGSATDEQNTAGASQAPGESAVASAETETEQEGGNGKINNGGSLVGLDDLPPPLPDFMSGLKPAEPDAGSNSIDFANGGQGRGIASTDGKEKNKNTNLAMVKDSLFYRSTGAIHRSCSRGDVRCQ